VKLALTLCRLSFKVDKIVRGTKNHFNKYRNGALGAIRTPDLMVRSHALYPTELQAHVSSVDVVLWKRIENRLSFQRIIFKRGFFHLESIREPAFYLLLFWHVSKKQGTLSYNGVSFIAVSLISQ
jgi:hypothetical protein